MSGDNRHPVTINRVESVRVELGMLALARPCLFRPSAARENLVILRGSESPSLAGQKHDRISKTDGHRCSHVAFSSGSPLCKAGIPVSSRHSTECFKLNKGYPRSTQGHKEKPRAKHSGEETCKQSSKLEGQKNRDPALAVPREGLSKGKQASPIFMAFPDAEYPSIIDMLDPN